MSYTPTNWGTGDTITASDMNKLENAVANMGNVAVIRVSASGYESSSKNFGYFAYAYYDSTNLRWELQSDDVDDWADRLLGYATPMKRLFVLPVPHESDIGLFFVDNGAPLPDVINTSGEIDSNAINLFYSFGSYAPGYRISGSGSIELVRS